MSASDVCAHERAGIEVGRQEQPRVASVMIIAKVQPAAKAPTVL